jgi:hypothetical protein
LGALDEEVYAIHVTVDRKGAEMNMGPKCRRVDGKSAQIFTDAADTRSTWNSIAHTMAYEDKRRMTGSGGVSPRSTMSVSKIWTIISGGRVKNLEDCGIVCKKMESEVKVVDTHAHM